MADQTPAEARETARLAPKSSPQPANPAPQSAGLTEDAIRAIIRDEIAIGQRSQHVHGPKSKWLHDASHSADASRQAAQAARDEAEFTTE